MGRGGGLGTACHEKSAGSIAGIVMETYSSYFEETHAMVFVYLSKYVNKEISK
jgi:hypothetical protein